MDFVRAKFFLILTCVFFSHCLLTNELGLQPAGTIIGSEAREQIVTRGTTSFYMAMSVVYDMLNVESGTNIYQISGNDAVDAFLTGTLAGAVSGIDDEKYYDPTSVDACAEEVQTIGGSLVMSLYQSARASQEASLIDNAEEVLALQAANCNIKESGKYVHLGNGLGF